MDKTISLCMIVKNDENNLRRCLDRVKDKVDQIVIIDTGSTDSTIQIANEFTQDVYSFSWCDDFAAARNESLKHATSDYIFVLNADEYLEQDADLKTGIRSGKDFYYMKIYNIFSPGRALRYTEIRLFANHKGIKYRDRLHEHLNIMDDGTGFIGGNCNVLIHHAEVAGDIMSSRAKISLNLPLMIQEVEENPTAYNLFNMGKKLMAIGEHENAVGYLKQAYPLSIQLDIVPELLSTLCHCLNELKRYEEALSVLKDAIYIYPDNTDLHYIRGCVFAEAGYMKDAICSFDKCLELDPEVTLIGGIWGSMAHYRLAEIYESKFQISISYEHIAKALKLNKMDAGILKKYFQIVSKTNTPLKDVCINIERIYRTSNVEEMTLILEVLYSLRHTLLNKYLTEFNVQVERNIQAVGTQFERKYEAARGQWMTLENIPEQNGDDVLLLAILLRDEELFNESAHLLKLDKRDSEVLCGIVWGVDFAEEQMSSDLENILKKLVIRLLSLQEFEAFQNLLRFFIGISSLDLKLSLGEILADYGFFEEAIDLLAKEYEIYPNDQRIITLLGDICMQMNYLEDAQILYGKLLELSNQYSDYERCYDLFEKSNDLSNMENLRMMIAASFPLCDWAQRKSTKRKLEVAFMPYKISMWDSMESIYREAMNDPDCNCYVVPIPYYEKNDQGEIIKFCYEGNEFPGDIQTIPFEMYEFENRKPDIIYIHNPFDNYNKLTMVQPRFFSENLAKYTDMLVYVPYYVAGGSGTTATNVAPAYIYATRIVAQSDVFKDALVRIGVPSGKILSLGSPKLDAMLTAMNKTHDIPPYWRYAMNNKKVFLFNNGITNLLSVEEWYEQLEYTLNYFIENENVALIWRPHPLTKITLKTMRPQYLERYSILRKRLQQVENIILDTESDIYAAVSISDGIISDYSSVMLQSIITGKPIYGLLNNKMIDSNQLYYANFSGCYFAGRDMSIPEFVEMVVRGEDPKKDERISRFVSSIVNSDGTSGQKIHYSIKHEVLRET